MAPAWLSAALEPVRAAYFPELGLWQPLLADFTAPAALLAGRAVRTWRERTAVRCAAAVDARRALNVMRGCGEQCGFSAWAAG
jgi:hypothetical protein